MLNTDKQWFLKNSWNQKPLSFTIKFLIVLFSQSDKLYQAADNESLKSDIFEKTDDFPSIFKFKLFIQFIVENNFG